MQILYRLLALILLLGNILISGFGQPLVDTRICIDAGHGGHTADDRQIFLPNGIVYWESEGDFTTSLHLKEMLEELGATVKLTRTDNSDASDISLSERSAIANTFGADFFHSIHTNGGGGTYSLVLYKEVNGSPAFPLAKEMGDIMAPNLQDLMKTVANYNRGDYSFLGFNLGVLRYANMPSTLSESSFHDLPEEGLRLKNDEYLKNYAWAMAKSFLAYFEDGGFETGRVGGVITDVTSGAVINEVTVSCDPGGISYTGDNYYNGFYAIGELEPGNYTLTLSKKGYLDNGASITIEANEYLDLDLNIQYYNNGFPNVDFYTIGTPAGAGELITFNGGNSTDDGTIEYFIWDFGDGSPQDSGMIVHHRFDMDGAYDVTMTAIDDDGNQSSITKTIEILTSAPEAPKLLHVGKFNEHNGLELLWQANAETNILNYHIFFSEDPSFGDESLLASVGGELTYFQLDSFGTINKDYHFRLTAENIANKVSPPGDIYSFIRVENSENSQDVLVVDGFNRKGSYTGDNHNFSHVFAAGLLSLQEYNCSSASNSAIITGRVNLEDYDIVFWFLGDESTVDETFSSLEQEKVKTYLEGGGKLFVTGAEIGWDLVAKGSSDDKAFYRNYLKANYLADGGSGRSPAKGVSASGFEGSDLFFGQVYPEDYPDEIGPIDGSEQVLTYKTGAGAGIKYKGLFGGGLIQGAVINIGFPLESVSDQQKINYFIEKVIAFFNSVSVNTSVFAAQEKFEVFPTAFDTDINLHYRELRSGQLFVNIYDLHGNVVESLHLQKSEKEGRETIDLSTLSSGFYFFSLQTPETLRTFKVFKK